MAFPPGDYFRITLRGDIVGGESWSFSHYQELTGLIDLPADADLQTVCDACESHAATLWVSLKAVNQAAIRFTGLELSFIRNGVHISTHQTNEGTAIPGTGTSVPQPVFLARVVTLQTVRAGRSYRGRMYLPYTGLNVANGTALWPTGSSVLTAVKTYMLGCTAEILTLPNAVTAGPVVYSVTAGAHEPVVALRMDNKPDTQRGREKSISATIFDAVTIP